MKLFFKNSQRHKFNVQLKAPFQNHFLEKLKVKKIDSTNSVLLRIL